MACFRAKCSNRLLLMESIKKLDPLCSPHCACLQPRDQRCDDRKEVIFSSPRKWRYKGGCVASVPADWRFAACLSNLGDMFPPRQMAWNIKLELQFLPTFHFFSPVPYVVITRRMGNGKCACKGSWGDGEGGGKSTLRRKGKTATVFVSDHPSRGVMIWLLSLFGLFIVNTLRAKLSDRRARSQTQCRL